MLPPHKPAAAQARRRRAGVDLAPEPLYEQAKHALAIQRVTQASATDIRALRERWYKPEEDGGLPISQKRAYVREALHAVIVYPAGPGRKPFDPDLLEPIWRE
jgi:hypothetical protein